MRNPFSPIGRVRTHRNTLVAIVVTTLVAVTLTPVVLAVHDLSMQLDGDVDHTTQQNVGGHSQSTDWDLLFDASGSPLPLSGGFTNSTFARDFSTTTKKGKVVFATADPTTFTTGSKDTLEIDPGWQCASSNNLLSKNDIMNAYAAAFTNPVADENGKHHQILYFAIERNSNNGDANVAFWFLQGNANCDSSNGTATWSGHHRDGDILIVSAFTNGGGVSGITAYEWQNGALNPNPVANGGDCQGTAGGDAICATTNGSAPPGLDAAITTPWLTANTDDGVGHTVQPSEFFEGGIDLTAKNLGDRCFNTFVGDTRSSQSLTATIFDYARGTLGACSVSMSTTPSTSAREAGSGAPVTDTATVTGTNSSGGSAPTPTGSVSFFLCGPAQLTPATTGTCQGSSGSAVTGNPKPVSESSPGVASATSGDAHGLISGTGKYCFRAEFTADPADENYAGQTAHTSNPAGECFFVVDARISIAPTATNEVGTPHTFTVTVRQDNGDGNGLVAPAVGTKPVVTFPGGAPGSVTDNCNGTGTDATGKCTVVVNSTVPGIFTAHATVTVTAQGVSLSRATDGTGNNSGDATKTYVDASIGITPTQTNEVGTAHTFTVTVKASDGSSATLSPVSGVKPTVTISPAPGSRTDNCAATGTNASGQCTVVINSNVGGTFHANASITLTLAGLPVTRDTAGNSGPGGTGEAVKTYVDASIAIAPTQTNEVGHAHTFTVTVKATDGSSATLSPVSGVKPTVTISPAPGARTDNCAATGTNASGQCTVVIDSDVTGVFHANASITLTLAGLPVTRDTAGNSGPGGSGEAVKTYVDGSISISPDDTNNITEQHTFTVHVVRDPGSGPVAAVGVHPVVTFVGPTPGTVVDHCASTGTNAGGDCTVVINSSVAGTFVAHAAIDLLFPQQPSGTVTVHRETDGTHGSSGDATKIYVAGSLVWHKVDQDNQPLGGASFQVCRITTLDTAPDPDVYDDTPDACVSVLDNTGQAGYTGLDENAAPGEFLLSGLILGQYTVQETAAPVGYDIGSAAVVQAPDMTLADPDVEIATPFVNLRLFLEIVITCNQTTSQLVVSSVTQGVTTLDTIGSIPASLLAKGVTQADLCGIGGAHFGSLHAGTYDPHVVIPK